MVLTVYFFDLSRIVTRNPPVSAIIISGLNYESR